MKRKHPIRQAAFTLVEIMVAIAILALVVAAIYATWTAILKASKVGLEAAATAQRERETMRMMQDALASARAYAANLPWYYFLAANGNEATLSFVSHLPKAFPRGGKFGDHDVRRVTFSVENGSNGERQLVLRQAPLLMEMDRDEQEHPLVLAKDVKKLEFGFWDPRRKEWVDDWSDNTHTNLLPQMVRITLALGAPGNYRYSWLPQVKEEEITCVVSLASQGVPQQWQIPNVPPMQPIPGAPNQPGSPIPGGRPLQPGGAVPVNPAPLRPGFQQ